MAPAEPSEEPFSSDKLNGPSFNEASVASLESPAAPTADDPDGGDRASAPYPISFEEPLDLPGLLRGIEVRLLEAFEKKLAFDLFKEKQIDRLHEELQDYKGDLLAKAVRPLITAMIKVHGDIVRLTGSIAREDPAKLTPERIVNLFDSFREEIEDLLADQGVRTFAETVNERFDVRRQASVGTVETSNPELIGWIAERVRPGFEQGATVIEKEKVKVYVAAR